MREATNLKESKEGVYRNIQKKERKEGNDVIILLKNKK